MMIENLENNPVLSDAIEKWGELSQLEMCIEECAELIIAIRHLNRERVGNYKVAEEVADVIIMALQVREIVGYELVDCWIQNKMDRLKRRTE